jgi:hypothetical protein
VSAGNVAYEEQYSRAIALSSAELGKAIKGPTKRITKQLGLAIAHEEKAKAARDQAKAEFSDNIAFYYEAKQRLLNPGYRTDVDSGKDRTPDENQKNFGAPDWATFNAQCNAYSLQHADRLLKQFAKSNGLLTDDGENIDDPDPKPDNGEPVGSGRRGTSDTTAQKRYEHVASAAMSIASSNPEGEVEKQILAAAEYIPAPVTPLQPDIYSEVLSFITKMTTAAPSENDKADAKRLLGKLLLFRPVPDPAMILADATAEEKRKRDRRLTKKNSRPLGTSEHVQRLELSPCADPEVVMANVNSRPEPGPESPATVPSTEVPRTRRRLNLSDVHAVTVTDHTQGPDAVKENLPLPNKDSTVQAETLVEDNSSVPLQDAAAQHGETACAQLVPGKKYQVRQAPSGGYGIYEGRSTALVQWYAEEDDARDAIDQLKECELVTDAGICPVCSKPYLRLDEQWHAHVYVHKEHKETGKRKPVLDSYCRTGAGNDNCPACGEKYVNAWWVPSKHRHIYYHNDTTVDGDSMLDGNGCKGPYKGKVKKAPASASEPKAGYILTSGEEDTVFESELYPMDEIRPTIEAAKADPLAMEIESGEPDDID